MSAPPSDEGERFRREADSLMEAFQRLSEARAAKPDTVLAATLVFLQDQVVGLAQEAKARRSGSSSKVPQLDGYLSGTLLALETLVAETRKYMGWEKPS